LVNPVWFVNWNLFQFLFSIWKQQKETGKFKGNHRFGEQHSHHGYSTYYPRFRWTPHPIGCVPIHLAITSLAAITSFW
jgi:hypothetical protein